MMPCIIDFKPKQPLFFKKIDDRNSRFAAILPLVIRMKQQDDQAQAPVTATRKLEKAKVQHITEKLQLLSETKTKESKIDDPKKWMWNDPRNAIAELCWDYTYKQQNLPCS